MARTLAVHPPRHDLAEFLLRSLIVVLTLATAGIHARLGGFLFTLNAIGYTGLALAMVLPGPAAAMRWLVRIALLGFTTATILGWIAFGARFELAYIDKAIEAVLVALLALEAWRSDGGPLAIARRLGALLAMVVARTARVRR